MRALLPTISCSLYPVKRHIESFTVWIVRATLKVMPIGVARNTLCSFDSFAFRWASRLFSSVMSRPSAMRHTLYEPLRIRKRAFRYAGGSSFPFARPSFWQ